MSEREEDPQAIDPPENTAPADNAMSMDSPEEAASAIDPPENTGGGN